MADLLLELFSEEIPARMQAGAARDLERLMVGALTDRGYLFEGIKAFAGPRRLTLAITGLPAASAGPRPHPRIGMGKFHGTMRPTTPTGSLNVTSSPPGTGICRPNSRSGAAE